MSFLPVQINQQGAQALIEQYKAEDDAREFLIKRCRDVLKFSKSSIYSVHREEIEAADEALKKASTILKEEILPCTAKFPFLRYTGSVSNAIEEWCEGKIFLIFKIASRIPSFEELEIASTEEYLGGLLDFTGELNRYAVLRATQQDSPDVSRCGDLIDRCMDMFLQFDFRNSNLRRKYDTLKYTQKKIESLSYELSLAKRLANVVPQSQTVLLAEETVRSNDDRED